MPQPKVFRASPRPEAEPLEFILETPRDDGSGDYDQHRFTANGSADAATFLAFGSAFRYDDHGEQVNDVAQIKAFFKACMPLEDYQRLVVLLDDPDKYIAFGDLANIYSWLISVYTGRPTQLRRGSDASPQPNGSSSTVVPLSAESISSP